MAIDKLALGIVDLTGRALSRVRFSFGLGGVSISVLAAEQPLDHRIKKLEEAQGALSVGLKAVEDLQGQAAQSKMDAERALQDLLRLEAKKSRAEDEFNAVRDAVSTDIEAFRKIAGTPDEAQRRRDKLTGFAGALPNATNATAGRARRAIAMGIENRVESQIHATNKALMNARPIQMAWELIPV